MTDNVIDSGVTDVEMFNSGHSFKAAVCNS